MEFFSEHFEELLFDVICHFVTFTCSKKKGFLESHVLVSSTRALTWIWYILKGLSLIGYGNMGHRQGRFCACIHIGQNLRHKLLSAIIFLLKKER